MGGFDAARFTPNNASFYLDPDISRDLVVRLQSITSTESNGSYQQLLPSDHLTLIDSTIAEIYLPIDACHSFERAYGLFWNTTYGMYFVDDELHENLVKRDLVFTFGIGDSSTYEPTVEITLPYSSFDLTHNVAFDSPPIRYFPIKRAMNDSQFILGRTFLQEAYLITDYERGNFSVFQSSFEEPIKQNIIPILSTNANLTTDPSPHQTTNSTTAQVRGPNLGRPEIFGIVLGTVLGFLLFLTLCCWLYILRRHRRHKGAKTMAVISSAQRIRRAFGIISHASESSVNRNTPSILSLTGYYGREHAVVPEIATDSHNLLREVPDTSIVELPENTMRFELPHPIRAVKLEHLVQRTAAKAGSQPPTSPQRRRGLILSTSGSLSRGNIVKYWMSLNGLRISQSESSATRATSAPARSNPSELEKSLPPTPISESPQESVFPAWTRVGTRRHEERSLYPPPLRLHKDPHRYRGGFF